MSFSDVIMVFVEPRKLTTAIYSLSVIAAFTDYLNNSLPFRPRDTRSRRRGPQLHREPHDHGRR